MEPKDVTDVAPLVLDKGMYVAIGMFIVWMFKNGGFGQIIGWFQSTKKEIRDEAKEGPIMVLERVERELKDCKESLEEVLKELRDVRQKHFDCETAHAELKAEVKHLRKQLGIPADQPEPKQ